MKNRPYVFTLLVCLYFSQGLPSGLLAHALPALMREYCVDLQWIGMIKVLALPWFFKFLWAPVIDQRWQRRNWILLFQSCVIPLLLFISLLQPQQLFGDWLLPFLLTLLLLNSFSASQDIATDGLAVARLPERWLGLANTVQVAAYKIGLILGGSYLLILLDSLGWHFSFQLFACLLLLALLPVVFAHAPKTSHQSQHPVQRIGIWRVLWGYLQQPGSGRWLLIIASYKVADELGSSMLKPLLVDIGLSLTDIGYMTSIASGCGLLGAAVSGLLFLRLNTRQALLLFGFLQALGIALFAGIPMLAGQLSAIYAVVMFEQFVDGLSTVVIFAAMMQHCRKGLEGTDYTLQNSFHLMGMGIAALLSGFIAKAIGYQSLFISAGIFGVAALALIVFSDDEQLNHSHRTAAV